MIKLIMELISLKGKIEMAHNNLNYRPAIKTRFIILLMLFITLNFSLLTFNSYSQWYAQTLPSYYDVADIKFFDANTGLIVLGLSTPGMLKTTNGGNN
jgi:hypothetical protein